METSKKNKQAPNQYALWCRRRPEIPDKVKLLVGVVATVPRYSGGVLGAGLPWLQKQLGWSRSAVYRAINQAEKLGAMRRVKIPGKRSWGLTIEHSPLHLLFLAQTASAVELEDSAPDEALTLDLDEHYGTEGLMGAGW